MADVSFPVSYGVSPPIGGSRCVRKVFSFNQSLVSSSFDFYPLSPQFDRIVSVEVDNTGCGYPVQIDFPDLAGQIVIPPFSRVLLPVTTSMLSGTVTVVVPPLLNFDVYGGSLVFDASVVVFFYNVDLPPYLSGPPQLIASGDQSVSYGLRVGNFPFQTTFNSSTNSCYITSSFPSGFNYVYFTRFDIYVDFYYSNSTTPTQEVSVNVYLGGSGSSAKALTYSFLVGGGLTTHKFSLSGPQSVIVIPVSAAQSQSFVSIPLGLSGTVVMSLVAEGGFTNWPV